MQKRKRHYCGQCKRWYANSSSFATHIRTKHGELEGSLPEGSKTPRTECKVNYPYLCLCGKEFRGAKIFKNHAD